MGLTKCLKRPARLLRSHSECRNRRIQANLKVCVIEERQKDATLVIGPRSQFTFYGSQLVV